MPEPEKKLEALLDLIEQGDDADWDRWADLHSDEANTLRDQRQIDLALRARVARDGAHAEVRAKILRTVGEQAAPTAVRQGILAAIRAEAQHVPGSGGYRGLLARLQDSIKSWPWRVFGTVLLIMCASLLWMDLGRVESLRSLPVAQVEIVSGIVATESGTLALAQEIRPQRRIRTGTNGFISLLTAGGTRLQVAANSEIDFSPDRKEGWRIARGIVALTVGGEEAMRVSTDQLKIEMVGGALNLEITEGRTWLRVLSGESRVTKGNSRNSVVVRAGQMLAAQAGEVAGKRTALIPAPFRRDIFQWPFTSDSPWNTPIGSEAFLTRITTPAWPPRDLSNGVLRREIIICRESDPAVNFLAVGEVPRQIRYPASWRPAAAAGEIVCAFFSGYTLCCEMTGPERLPSGDIRALERNSTDLTDSGMRWSWPQPRSIGGSALGGVIRRGELTWGISHALAVAVHPHFLNRHYGAGGRLWPAVPFAPDMRAMFGTQGNLAIGTLLVLPPSVNITNLVQASTGPAFQIARALQDYGAYIMQSAEADFQLVASNDAGLPPELDAILRRLVPELRIVQNNHPGAIGGGGVPRRAPAPDLDL